MNLEREMYSKLLEWKEQKNNKPAILYGIKGVGKTKITNDFGNNEYASYLNIDCEMLDDVEKKTLQNGIISSEFLYMYLQKKYGKIFEKNNTLLVLDEACELKYFKQLALLFKNIYKFDVICTTSYTDFELQDEQFLFLKLNPLNFEEFCCALGNNCIIDTIRSCYNNKTSLSKNNHKKAMEFVKKYMIIGGMPKSVCEFISGEYDFLSSIDENNKLLNQYETILETNDLKHQEKVMELYKQIPSYLSQENKRIKMNEIAKKSSYNLNEKYISSLVNNMFVDESYSYDEQNANSRKYLKLYYSDTSILMNQALNENVLNDTKLFEDLTNNKFNINNGMLFENMIAQNLTSKNYTIQFYFHINDISHRSDATIDMIIRNKDNNKLIPIIIKPHKKDISSKSFRENIKSSIDNFKKLNKEEIDKTYVIYSGEYCEFDDIICIPPYMITCL